VPVTPFHLGVGALAKGIAPSRISFAAFAMSQAVIDCETVYYLWIVREWPLHRWAHTFLIGSCVAVAAGAALFAAAKWTRPASWWPFPSEWQLTPCILGGLLGGLSHPLLDGIMHADVEPLKPFAVGNPLLGALSLTMLHVLCVACGVLGLALLTKRPHP